jgi:hypothetical protein|tara:strand:+ start:4753 stop:4860 length:108 start_codon:yes stop_codon:yes gene_type:complete
MVENNEIVETRIYRFAALRAGDFQCLPTAGTKIFI